MLRHKHLLRKISATAVSLGKTPPWHFSKINLCVLLNLTELYFSSRTSASASASLFAAAFASLTEFPLAPISTII